MPPKKVICIICREEVSKRQTWAFKDGRACKCHETTQKEKLYSDGIKANTIRYRIDNHERSEISKKPRMVSLRPHCYHCGVEGIKEWDIISRLLVNIQKHLEVTGNTILPIFDKERIHLINMVKRDFGVNELVALYYINTSKFQEWQLRQLVKIEYRPIVDMTKLVLLCGACIKNFKIERQAPQKIQSLSTKQMYLIGSIVEEEFKKIAIRELNERRVNE